MGFHMKPRCELLLNESERKLISDLTGIFTYTDGRYRTVFYYFISVSDYYTECYTAEYYDVLRYGPVVL